MSVAELMMMVVIAAFGAVVWFLGEILSPRETEPGDHLCSNGEFMPGPMHECTCRDEWAGLG